MNGTDEHSSSSEDRLRAWLAITHVDTVFFVRIMLTQMQSPQAVRTDERAEMLDLARQWLGMDLDVEPDDLTTVELTYAGYQRSSYASVFARQYNNLVGMSAPGSLASLYDGTDPRGTGPFLAKMLSRHRCRTALDTCGACQYDIIYLRGAQARGEVGLTKLTSNELDESLLAQGLCNLEVAASARGFSFPQITTYPWQELAVRFGSASFDGAFCMGNSFSHLSDAGQRRRCIANFASVVNDVFILDTRNFHQMLANAGALRERATSLLTNGKSADAGNKVLFPGSVANFPVYIDDRRIITAYVRHGDKLPYALVEFSPLLLPSMVDELSAFFGNVEVYCDYRKRDVLVRDLERSDAPSTFQFVCTLPKHHASRAELHSRIRD